MDYDKRSLEFHQGHQGKISTELVTPITGKDDLSIMYTPGVAAVSRLVAEDPTAARTHTIKGRSVAVVSDGSAVLGLGNIGPLGALPVMEGKAALFKQFAGLDAWPIVLDTQDTQEIIDTVRRIAPGFAGINLEDISAPRCFEIEEALQDLGIPVFHDDQHGTAIVTLAGLMNAAKVVGKNITDMTIIVSGAGAAGTAIIKLLQSSPETTPENVILCDSQGIVHADRTDLNPHKQSMLSVTNSANQQGSLTDALVDADVFIGVSAPGIISADMVQSMATDSIIFAMANPTPEIMPDIARKAGAAVVATGRSDFPNQVNNVLAFPGIFRGAIDSGAPRITNDMKIAAARALSSMVSEPTSNKIIPGPFDPGVAGVVAKAVQLPM